MCEQGYCFWAHWRISFAGRTIEVCLGTLCVSHRPVLISDFLFCYPKPVSGVFQLAEHYCLLWTVIYRHMCNLLTVYCSRDRSLGDASP